MGSEAPAPSAERRGQLVDRTRDLHASPQRLEARPGEPPDAQVDADIVEAVPVSQAGLLDPELVTEVPMPRTNTLYLNTERGAFRDPALRAAAREAVDTRSLVSGVYEGRADRAGGLLGPALPWAAKLRTPVRHTAATAPKISER